MNNVVLIHGMWSTGRTLRPVAEFFAKRGFRVSAPTLPDHSVQNASCSRLARYSITDYRNFISDHADVGSNTILVGHSMGGLVAQMIASTKAVKGLVLLGSPGPRGINHIYPGSLRSSLHVLTKWRFWSKTHKPCWENSRRSLFNSLEEKTARGYYEAMTHESGRVFGEIAFWMFDRQRATEIDPGSIDCPMLILAGGQDRLVVPEASEQIRRFYSRCEYRMFANLTHWLFDDPGNEAMYDALDQWLLRHDMKNKTHGVKDGCAEDQLLSFCGE